jgi:hypothetical protein
VNGLKHQKEKRSMDHFAGLDVSVKETSVCLLRLLRAEDGTSRRRSSRVFGRDGSKNGLYSCEP